MKTYSVGVEAAGSAGAATGSETVLATPGLLCGIVIVRGNASATTDVTITETINGVSRTLLTATNIAAIASYSPAIAVCDSSGAPIANQFLPVPVYGGRITVTVAQSDPDIITNVTLLIGD